MRERSPAVTQPKVRVSMRLRAAVEWLRAGYSAEAPSTAQVEQIRRALSAP